MNKKGAGDKIDALGYCPDAQCIDVIASEMRKMGSMDKRKNARKWQNKNKLMAINISRKMNNQAAAKKKQQEEEEIQKEMAAAAAAAAAGAAGSSPSNSTNKKKLKSKKKKKKETTKKSNDDKSGSTSMTIKGSKRSGTFKN